MPENVGGGFFILNQKLANMALSWREQMNDQRWIEKSEKIKQRDEYKCLVCNSNEHYIEVHHLYYMPGMLAWEYDDESLVTICRKHHEQLTYDMPKVSGLIAFEVLRSNIDLTNLIELLKTLKFHGRLGKAA